MDVTTLNVIITAGISALGAVLSFIGARKGAKSQIESTEKSIKKDLKIASMNIEAKIVSENKIEWINEVRNLIAKFIRKCSESNIVLSEVEWIEKYSKIYKEMSDDNEDKEKVRDTILNKIDETSNIKTVTAELNEIYSLTKLHFFEQTKEQLVIISQMEKMTGYLAQEGEIPPKQLEELIDVANKYIKQEWEELTK